MSTPSDLLHTFTIQGDRGFYLYFEGALQAFTFSSDEGLANPVLSSRLGNSLGEDVSLTGLPHILISRKDLEAFSTLPEEVALVWASERSALNLLFFLNQYFPWLSTLQAIYNSVVIMRLDSYLVTHYYFTAMFDTLGRVVV
ncbi:hypothetical protein DICSQDRAFT_174623 [Dichomitus squalens LYAD-421 SS1]|uniref:DUF6533 domain-containing protein n=1 Tax=Dichomitus squalens (strain LYAD-421) TaxID=732165 RepID=R7SLP2_DICSQ|nr:uncharacterized protein DICSQDRAFT_174623 [Dichomitus squalens LYAD-421 SS1]EJF56763.1 hypothetical protein DICSQDRAFT_174623 [Dichomitus squalens LYAD-421 SS1]